MNTEAKSGEAKIGIHFLGLDLSAGVTRTNMLAYLFVAFVSSSYAGALAVLQPALLQVMGISYAEQATLTGMLGALQEVIFFVMLGVYGALADRIGRRPVYVFGLLTISIAFVLYPHATSIPMLVAFRVIVAVGGAAMMGMMVTVIADYATNKDRGKANGLQGVVATLGAFVPPILGFLPKVFVGNGLGETEAVQATFAVGGALGILGMVVAFAGLSRHVGTVSTKIREPIVKMMREGLRCARDPGVALSYGAAFISRGDLAVTGAFMGLWLVQHGTGVLGLTPSEAMFQLAAPRVLVTVAGAFVGAILMGILADKVSRVTAVSMASGLAAMVYLAVYLVEDPTAGWVFGLLAVMGVAEISAFVSSQALVGQQAPANRRGAVIGFFGAAGAVGIFLGTAGGGWLFARFGPSAPFVLFGVLNLVVFLWSLKVRRTALVLPDSGD